MKKTLLFSICALCAIFSCTQKEDYSTPNSKKVTLTLAFEEEEGTKASIANGNSISTIFQKGDIIKVNGEECTVAIVDGKPSITVTEAPTYQAWYPSYLCCAPVGIPPTIPGTLELCKLQPAQYVYYDENGVITSMGKFNPLWADPTTNTTNTSLKFKHVGAILKITISGPATTKIETIKIEDNSGKKLAGEFIQNASGALAPKDGSSIYYNYVVLNCGTGVALSESGTPFYIYMPEGNYDAGFKITISDNAHKSMIVNSITPRTLSKGHILNTPTITYAPAADLIWSDYFDTFAWGDNYMTGVKGYGAGNNGTEPGLYSIERDDAATITIAEEYYHNNRINGTTQENRNSIVYRHNLITYSPTNGSTRFAMVYEAPGYMSCGYGASRCLIDFPKFPTVPSSGNVKLSFDIARNINDLGQSDINFQIKNGTITSVAKNGGTPYTATNTTDGITFASTTKITFNKSTSFIPEDVKGWVHIDVTISNATINTYPMFFQTTISNVARFYIDNVVVTAL